MKKNTGLILLYLCIFFGVTMALQAAAGKETYTSYESEKIKIGVVDKDKGPLAEGLVKWFENTHHVTMLEDNREKLQEELFYRNIEYIVVIPEDFYESCMVNGESISVTKVERMCFFSLIIFSDLHRPVQKFQHFLDVCLQP